MKEILCREITRRLPFEIGELPWILKVYRYPFDRWSGVGKQGLFGAPNFLLFYLYKNFFPARINASFLYAINGTKKRLLFNPKNTQYSALYLAACSMGYEPQVNALLDLITPDKGVFYDAGSNWGWFPLMLASRPGFQGRSHAFEAFPPNYADLTDIVRQAGLTGSIQCHHVALSDHEGMSSIHLPDHIHSGCATVTTGTGNIKTIALDSFSGEPPDVMKIDVEGVELKVLKGAKALLQKHQPMIVFENKRYRDNPAETMQPIQFLEKLGYVFYHPAWLRMIDQSPCLLGDDLDPDPRPTETLALVPFQSAQRPLLHDLVNIFACHQDKVPALKSLFETRQV